MLIKSIEVKNFRSLRDARLCCDDYTIMIGRNGAGKSSFLHAIDVFYNLKCEITEEDFFNRNIGEPIEINITFGDLSEKENTEFKSYIDNDTFVVTKRFYFKDNKVEQKYFASSKQIPKFAEIRKIVTKTDKKNAWNKLVDSGEFEGLSEKPRKADDIESVMLAYEEKHSDQMTFIEREEQLFGPPNIGGGKLDNYTKFVLIPAVRDACDEVSDKKGSIYRLLDMIVLRQINARSDIKEFNEEYEKRIKDLYSSENLKELPILGESITSTLCQFSPGAELKLKWSEVIPPTVNIPTPLASLVEDEYEGEITKKGHGLQRALVVTLLQHLAITKPLSEDDSQDSFEPDLIIGIEEPELYLHPSRSRYLSKLLYDLATNSETGLGGRNQILCASHSPYFLDISKFEDIRIICKSKVSHDVFESTVKNFTLQQARIKIADICQIDPLKITAKSITARSTPIMNSIVSEGFFSNTVVIVEGLSDLGILWKLQEVLEEKWNEKNIVIVSAGGKNNIDRPVIIFKGFDIPTYFVFDGDYQNKGKKDEKNTIEKNRKYLRLAGTEEIDFPDTTIGKNYAVFKEGIEQEIKKAIGEDIYNQYLDEIKAQYGYAGQSNVIKNIECSSKLIELLYNDNHSVPHLEEIVRSITALN